MKEDRKLVEALAFCLERPYRGVLCILGYSAPGLPGGHPKAAAAVGRGGAMPGAGETAGWSPQPSDEVVRPGAKVRLKAAAE